ncbi:hypothetical protein MKW98_006529 [Papaver atlanticum]|uniref:N-acetyltransferase domain-containing protein n=1 Tax=Papaver atlanticum TaxID=357466 RepID=A0AAD4T9M2_9MAGN|nr:hypothetical protein MKW98_006529 [Papaver atlanticum]
MVYIRQAAMNDIPPSCNFLSHPEEVPIDYTNYEADTSFQAYIVSRHQLVYVAEDRGTGGVVGYVVAKMQLGRRGYISYMHVIPTHRKQGIEKKLMTAVENAMVQEYGSEYVSLHVCYTNEAAVHFFLKKLGYKHQRIATKFYFGFEFGEDVVVLGKQLNGKRTNRLGHGFFLPIIGKLKRYFDKST